MYIYLINPILLFLMHYLFFNNKNYFYEKYVWIFVIFFLSIFIGFRYEIGGDWVIYQNFFDNISEIKFNQIIVSSPIYVLINKIAFYSNINFVGVNFICSIIFMFSLAYFLQNSKNRWLALAISFPIIIVVLGMGYTRQGLAFSFCLLLIRSLEDKKIFLSFIYVIVAILTHKSALFVTSLLIFLNFWYYKKYHYLFISILIPLFFLIFYSINYKHLIYFYIGEGQHMFSYGSFPRAILITIIAITFLLFRKKFKNMTNYQVFIYSSFCIIILFLLPFSFLASIVSDRLLFYLYPLKLALFSFANLKDKKIRSVIYLITFVYYFYFISWLSFGVNSFSWVPYKFVVF